MKQTLNGQIALTKYHSLREFKERLRDGKLMIKAQNELLFLRDTFKFEYYVKRYQLDPEAERRLIRSGRKDLFCIYFRFRRCHRSTDTLSRGFVHLRQVPFSRRKRADGNGEAEKAANGHEVHQKTRVVRKGAGVFPRTCRKTAGCLL